MHIQVISEWSCDNEHWHNDCWKFCFANYRYVNKWYLKYVKIGKNIININIPQYYCVCCMFDQINAALVRIRGFFQFMTQSTRKSPLQWVYFCLIQKCLLLIQECLCNLSSVETWPTWVCIVSYIRPAHTPVLFY